MKLLTAAIFLCIFFSNGHAYTQNLSFTKPVQFLSKEKTDKAIDITNFKGGYFVTWKDAGSFGNVHVSFLGKQYDTSFTEHAQKIENETSAFAPVLRVLNNRIYLLWIAKDGSLKYIINNSNNSFDAEKIYTFKFTNPAKLSYGITSCPFKDKLVIASHADNKSEMVYAIIESGNDGIFKDAELKTVPGKTSADYPFIVTLPDTAIRISYRGYKDENIYYADYNMITNKWSKEIPVSASKSKTSPAIYSVWNSSRMIYIWKGSKNDNKIYYATDISTNTPGKAIALPGYFSTNNPVSICLVDDKNFIMAYISEDKKFYFSYFSNYNPATWMKDLIMPTKENLTLQDIIIPGSHDAGMSVLTATGGMQSGTINNCNTLTQTQNISAQLNAGIRMFDLRVGVFNKQLYTKHCSSDCMDSAIGGGYGEKMGSINNSIKKFLKKNNQEIIILSLSHFCEKEITMNALADSIVNGIGKDLIYMNTSKQLGSIPLKELAGKVIITFENYAGNNTFIHSNSIANASTTFMNFRREYAGTNDINKMLGKQITFFNLIKEGINKNDLVRLDWQLTESADEAAMVCNDFQNENTNVVVNGLMLLTNVVRKHKSIIDLSLEGNKYIPSIINEWINNGTINKKNKPNILYVDAAGAWVTDYCIGLNKNNLYN